MQTASVLEWYDRHRVYNIWFKRRRKLKLCELKRSAKISAERSGDADASPNKYFLGKVDWVWENLIRFDRIWGKLRGKLGKIEARF